MARSPLTLAASVTAALPRAGVVSVAPLTEGLAGRYDSALTVLDDDRRVVVKAPTGSDAERDLRAEVLALAALTAGVRAVLPFQAPAVLGDSPLPPIAGAGPSGAGTSGAGIAVVQTWLPGYRVDAAHVPGGRGVAPALGSAIAAIHDLPASVVRDAGLPVRDAARVRADAERLLDRAEGTGLLPFGLLRRWSAALASDSLWRFESVVTLGGVDPASFLLDDGDDEEGTPTVTGLLNWSGLSVGDPAVDLRWLASAPEARLDVLDAYVAASPRSVDAAIGERARLHAELEFASWLVHGHEDGAEGVVADAVALLESLDESVRDAPALAQEAITVDDALAVLGRVPETAAVDTSMQTDTYDAEALADFTPDHHGAVNSDERGSMDSDERGSMASAERGSRASADLETAPLDFAGWTPAAEADGTGGSDDPDEAARNALRRWTESA